VRTEVLAVTLVRVDDRVVGLTTADVGDCFGHRQNPVAELVDVLDRRAEHPAHDRQRNGHSEIGDDVAASAFAETLDEAVHECADVGFHRFDGGRLEDACDGQTFGCVRRWIARHEHTATRLAKSEARPEFRRPRRIVAQ
jgi:hypothetical protein